MQIDRLLLEGFRNYDSQQLTFDGSCNVIYGENAQGKTNLLEAIVYLSCGRSPRTHADRELIGFDRDRARLVGHIQAREREFETEILLNRGRRRRMTVNGVAAKNGGDLSQVLHTVFFSPEDLFLIREGAAAPNSGVPGIIGGYGAERVLHAQAAGIFRNLHSIADFVEAGEAVAEIETPDGQRLPVVTQISGILRGLLRDGYPVTKGFKVADVDPRRAELENCFLISDKARCIAGSVLELITAACWN